MKYFLVITVLFISSFVYSQKSQTIKVDSLHFEINQGVSVSFLNRDQNIGPIKRGDIKEMEFNFVNTGTEELKIEIVSGCECTTLDWPRKPIKPGEKATIKAKFDSTQKEKSETVEIDVNFKNIDPKSGYPMLQILSYTFELI